MIECGKQHTFAAHRNTATIASMFDLTRLTCEYIDREDRIRFTGETADGATVVIWVTQRLLYRLVPHLCKWVEQNSKVAGVSTVQMPGQSTLWQGFAQQAAQAQITPQPVVRHQQGAPKWLALAVDVDANAEHLSLNFRGEEVVLTAPDAPAAELSITPQGARIIQRCARMVMPVVQARQWLGIIHHQCRQGGWPLTVWPEWMEEAQAAHTQQASSPPATLH
jgi:hypothetical protein